MSEEAREPEAAGEVGPAPGASGTSADPEAEKAAPIQFEKAEFDEAPAAAPACAACKKPVESIYFQMGTAIVCASCRDGIEGALATAKGRARFVRALGYGLGAAAVGSVIWYAVREITQMEIGLVAIGIGILVGLAVKRGAGGLGGKRYQALAVALTYASITMTNVPLIVKELRDRARTEAVSSAASAAPAVPTAPTAAPDPAKRSAAQPTPAADRAPPTLFDFLLVSVIIVGMALVLPFLAGAQNIIGIVIIGIGLYQAWKITRFIPPVIRGPFKVEGAADPADTERA